jgi:multiple sugar transport system ATP-binding protein
MHRITLDQDHGTPAVIQVIEPTGADTHLLAEIAGQTVTCVLPSRLKKKVSVMK